MSHINKLNDNDDVTAAENEATDAPPLAGDATPDGIPGDDGAFEAPADV